MNEKFKPDVNPWNHKHKYVCVLLKVDYVPSVEVTDEDINSPLVFYLATCWTTTIGIKDHG